MDITLPKDLKKYVIVRILNRILPCTLIFIVLGGILIEWGDVIFKTDNASFQHSCYVVVMILPFVLTGVPHKLVDRTYHGIVTKVDVVTTFDNKSSVKPTREGIYTKNIIFLTVLLDNGKTVRKKVYEGGTKTGQHLSTYNEGDTVFHLYGTNITIVLPDNTDTNVQCAVCGASNEKNIDKCRICEHTLIKK